MPFSEPAGAYAFEQLEPADHALTVSSDGVRDILSSARAAAERIREKARVEGAAEGREQGLADARAQARPALAALAQSLVGMQRVREELCDQLEHDAVDLALRLSEQILAGAIAAQPERVVDVVRGALRRVSDRRRVTVLVNPDDLELVGAALDGVRAQLGGIEHGEVQADRRVTRGGAVIRTSEGAIDAQLDTQLARARQLVAEDLAGDERQQRDRQA